MADQSISNTVFRMVLSQANKEQNQHYPPSVFEAHYMLTTNALIDECAKLYPGTQSIVDLIKPYFKAELVRVVNGIIPFPKTYRHLLGYGIYLDENEHIPEKCKKIEPDITASEIKELLAESQSSSFDATQVSIGRWNKLTKHRYKRPTLTEAICCIFNSDGIKISPVVPVVEVRYIIKTEPFKYGYLENEDGSFYFDAANTQEALWTENAISYLFKGINTLYSNYIRDPEQVATAKDLRDTWLF